MIGAEETAAAAGAMAAPLVSVSEALAGAHKVHGAGEQLTQVEQPSKMMRPPSPASLASAPAGQSQNAANTFDTPSSDPPSPPPNASSSHLAIDAGLYHSSDSLAKPVFLAPAAATPAAVEQLAQLAPQKPYQIVLSPSSSNSGSEDPPPQAQAQEETHAPQASVHANGDNHDEEEEAEIILTRA